MIVKLLTEHHLEFLSLNEGCTGSSEYTHVKMPHCWKSHATAQIIYKLYTELSQEFLEQVGKSLHFLHLTFWKCV